MHMIGHDEKEMRPPQTNLLSMFNCLEQPFSDVWQCQLIGPASSTIDRDEINLLSRINPERHLMRQEFSPRNMHTAENKKVAWRRNAKVGTARCAVRAAYQP